MICRNFSQPRNFPHLMSTAVVEDLDKKLLGSAGKSDSVCSFFSIGVGIYFGLWKSDSTCLGGGLRICCLCVCPSLYTCQSCCLSVCLSWGDYPEAQKNGSKPCSITTVKAAEEENRAPVSRRMYKDWLISYLGSRVISFIPSSAQFQTTISLTN